ncbi:MAG: hypothetical protein V3U56_12120 [Syntrophobacteria bacterium]
MAKGKKHSLVQCRIEACQKVDEIVKEKEVSIREAMRELAGSQGVPFNTLRHWYYKDDESNKSGLKVQPPQVHKSTAKVKAKVINKIVDNIAKARKKEEEDAMSTSHGQAARELADGLGGAVLAEELYELFLKAVSKVDEIIKANKELEDPMQPHKVIEQILRIARNSGWEEYKPPEGLCEKCKIKDRKVTCPNRTCENNVPKKKQVKGKAKAKGEK